MNTQNNTQAAPQKGRGMQWLTWLIVVVVLALIIIFVVIGVSKDGTRRARMNIDTETLVEDEIEEINTMVTAVSAPAWSFEAVEENASSFLVQQIAVDASALEFMVEAYNESLGSITSIDESTVIAEKATTEDIDGNEYMVANYFAEASFEKSVGELRLELLREEGRWKLVSFSVESLDLIEYMEARGL